MREMSASKKKKTQKIAKNLKNGIKNAKKNWGKHEKVHQKQKKKKCIEKSRENAQKNAPKFEKKKCKTTEKCEKKCRTHPPKKCQHSNRGTRTASSHSPSSLLATAVRHVRCGGWSVPGWPSLSEGGGEPAGEVGHHAVWKRQGQQCGADRPRPVGGALQCRPQGRAQGEGCAGSG